MTPDELLEHVERRLNTQGYCFVCPPADATPEQRSNVEKLQAKGLPVLSTPADVAAALGITVPRLLWLAYHTEASTLTHYVHFMVPKKSGGERTLHAPLHLMGRAQRWALETIVDRLPVEEPCRFTRLL